MFQGDEGDRQEANYLKGNISEIRKQLLELKKNPKASDSEILKLRLKEIQTYNNYEKWGGDYSAEDISELEAAKFESIKKIGNLWTMTAEKIRNCGPDKETLIILYKRQVELLKAVNMIGDEYKRRFEAGDISTEDRIAYLENEIKIDEEILRKREESKDIFSPDDPNYFEEQDDEPQQEEQIKINKKITKFRKKKDTNNYDYDEREL
jgi:hypothetical protein